MRFVVRFVAALLLTPLATTSVAYASTTTTSTTSEECIYDTDRVASASLVHDSVVVQLAGHRPTITERLASVSGSSTTPLSRIVATEDFTVYRFGKDSLTLDRLTTDAVAAAGAGLPYGFSVSDRLPPNRAGDSLSAPVSDLNRAEFCVEQTGSKKNHYTVHLDQPLTQAQVDLLNGLFT